MVALVEACREGRVPGNIELVIGEREDAPALHRARALGVQTHAGQIADWAQVLSDHRIEWICLAGFLKLIPGSLLSSYSGRILNIHPALLPKFGGKGMYGMHVHEAVVRAGETVSGCTVHLVTEHYDEGPILLQLRCPVFPNEPPEELAARVLELEHATYPLALAQAILTTP